MKAVTEKKPRAHTDTHQPNIDSCILIWIHHRMKSKMHRKKLKNEYWVIGSKYEKRHCCKRTELKMHREEKSVKKLRDKKYYQAQNEHDEMKLMYTKRIQNEKKMGLKWRWRWQRVQNKKTRSIHRNVATKFEPLVCPSVRVRSCARTHIRGICNERHKSAKSVSYS